MKPSAPQILVIGCGSIGERHVGAFLATGRVAVVACDPDPAIRGRMTEKYGVAVVADWEAALDDPALVAAVIATPAPFHVPMAVRVVEKGRHVLIEKPLGIDLAGTECLTEAQARTGKFVALAYVHHLQPALQGAREFIQSRRFGLVRHATVITGQHFPTARPAYREIYYRDHAQGGGAIQDALTHMANGVEWVLGPTHRVFCDASHQVLDGVEVEDTVSVAARNGGALVTYALNQFQAPNETRLDFHAPGGSVRVELHTQRWGTLAHGETEWNWRATPVADRDELFIAQAHAFLDGCGGRSTPLCTLQEGIQTVRFNLAALRSWRTGQPVVP
jgi:predicted dehydrogenase